MSSATDRAETLDRLDELRGEIADVLEDELDDGDSIDITEDLAVRRRGDRVSIETSSGVPDVVETDAATALLLSSCLDVLVDPRWS